jgi:hypothetical protein
MNLNQLTNFQLYEIIQNPKLDKLIKAGANEEFNLRGISIEELEEITSRHNALSHSNKSEPLNIKYKILALTIPFFWVIHILITSRYLSRGQKRKWNEYWLFFCIGLLLWTIATVIIGKQMVKQD